MLDFGLVTAQMETFSQDQKSARALLQAALAEAGRRFRAAGLEWEAVRDKIARSRTSWMLPSWLECPDRVYPPGPRPLPSTTFATDGSQIVADRHDLALCYLLNIGYIVLRYGTGESATLCSKPILAMPDESLFGEFQSDQEPIALRRLSIQRLIQEVAGLISLIEEEATRSAEHIPMLALFDGSLILWTLEAETDEQFRNGALETFQSQLDTARERRVPVAGYISKPMSKDVVNSLRIHVCPHDKPNCDKHCPNRSKPKPSLVLPECAGTERVTDAEMFEQRLRPGERSALFRSGSKILDKYRPENQIIFFYLHTGREVARVEIPAWAAEDPELLARTHSLCYDQAVKGDGYPVALAEAHEQAIVRGAERAAFFHLMERKFVGNGLPLATTQKAVSKRARRV